MGIANPFRKNNATSNSKNASKSAQNLPEPSDYINANYVSGYKPCGRSWDKGNYSRFEIEITNDGNELIEKKLVKLNFHRLSF